MMKKILKRFGINSRSLPNEKNFKIYYDICIYPVCFFGGFNFLNIIFIIDGIDFEFPKIFIVIFAITFFEAYSRVEREHKVDALNDVRKIILYIQMNHLQSLTEELIIKPEISEKKYRNRTLLYWAKHYKNVEAHKIILRTIKNK